jgi:hypothetical protein
MSVMAGLVPLLSGQPLPQVSFKENEVIRGLDPWLSG